MCGVCVECVALFVCEMCVFVGWVCVRVLCVRVVFECVVVCLCLCLCGECGDCVFVCVVCVCVVCVFGVCVVGV